MFAAYANKVDKDKGSVGVEERKTDNPNEWLANSSFTVNSEAVASIQCIPKEVDTKTSHPECITVSSDSESDEDSDDSIDLPHTPQGSPGETLSELDQHPGSPVTPSGSPRTSETSGKDSDGSRSKSQERQRSRSYDRRSSSSRSLGHGKSRSRGVKGRRSRSPSYSQSGSSDREKSRSRRERSRGRERSKRRSRSRQRTRSRSSKRKPKYRSRSRDRAGSSKHEKERRRRNSESRETKPRMKNDGDVEGKPFFEDRTKAYGNLNVPTLSRPAIAWYKCSRRGLGIVKGRSLPSVKRTLKHRYYNQIVKKMEADLTAFKERDKNEEKNVGQIQGVNDVEEEISKMTAKFNQDLAEDPQNVDIWRKYVQFQDVVHQFERVYRRGGGASGARVTSERKLSILDKALKENPTCEELLKERCDLAESVLPMDKLTLELKTRIGTDPGNLILWDSLIMASQGSLSSCKVPVVKALYQQALTNIQSVKRSNSESVKTMEAKLIDLVLHLGLFFRQSGLLELMWSLISVYLEFNLAKLDPTKFHITNTVADNALMELEEAILSSQLPLPTLWLRVEALRAGTHWVPLPADAESEDPQRLVFPEDINDLIHPINSAHLTFRLVTVTLTLLKVPLLPWRESAAKAAGLHPLPWLLDGPEPLYASLLPLGTLEFKQTSSLLKDASQLACGPQYLITRPGQDEYLDFLSQVFSASAECLPPTQKTYLLVWWLRFYRWLMQLERLGHCKLPRGRKKKMRTAAKDLLRQDDNRSNFLLFKEFSLLELENGSIDGAKKVLQGTISALPSNKPVPIAKDRASICTLYRVLVEVYLSYTHVDKAASAESSEKIDLDLKNEDRKKAISLLVSLGRGTPLKIDKPSSTDVAAAISKFHHVTREVLDNPSEEELDPFIAPDVSHVAPTFLVEWTSCHGWLLFLSNSIWKAATVFENVLSELKSDPASDAEIATHDNFIQAQREALFEAYISLLRHHCFETRGSFTVLREVLLRGLMEFPGNLTFSAALSDLETNSNGSGLPLWRLSKVFCELNSAPAHALFVFIMRYRLKQQESSVRDAYALLGHGGPEIPDPNIKNRMTTLLKKLTKHPVMRRCPMLWRLRLQFAAAISCNDEECSRTFYLALEDCPWSKALYMDIVQVLPTQLGQVQDLLVEKELRLHVTPEELEILRPDS